MFILNHVSYADNGTSLGVLGPYRTLDGAQAAAAGHEEDWRGTTTGAFSGGGWDEIDGDDFDRHVWVRDLHVQGGVVGAVEIYEFDGMGD